ncbi:hypothetical protein KIW84_074829 [Lathyrus oleraceus]|uniref:Uncharacterized protein n=1 Tax=Pisum sativum TaxID=3888 RepID=A0A9D5A126_PEA|nr:hypothetical protein KIW84_074829 [Pisum sativum]
MVTKVLEMNANNGLHKQATDVSNGRGESSLSHSNASKARPNAKRVRDDEKDNDWEPCPMEKFVEVVKWFYKNCTMNNLDNNICCEVCGDHKEVEKEINPHPERPDRLRAIVAHLTRAGVFLERCYPILAREITQEDITMVHSS